ncbi:MAG TPA: ABC transporter permease, partial [Blastocatellia bacterium]|nr:ABC transporter permease [Blastocatellia bacterium]
LCLEYAWLKAKVKRPIHGSGWWPVSRMGFRNATHRPGRSILCIALIASAAFIIVAVDAFRRDAGDDPLDKKSGGGGFPLLAETLLPLYHDPNTEEGREAMTISSQKDFNPERVPFMPFRVRPGDDTSCLNLYQPKNPRILAPADEFLKSNRFAFQDSLAETDEDKANPWLLLTGEAADGAVPVVADANSMTYVLHRKLGDEIVIDRNNGEPVRLRLVAALRDSLFQGELLMSEKNFLQLFPDQGGYGFFLLDVAPAESAAVAGILEEQLSDFGFDVTSTAERIASFHRVENTYLSTFQTLGGLGLILGTMGLATVLLRNVLERRKELALLRAVGYGPRHFALMALTENLFLVCCGLATGAASALLAIAPALFSRGGRPPTLSLILLLMTVLVTGLAASVLATRAALRSPLLPALRAE